MSPFERHDDKLRDMQLGGSGQRGPEQEPPPEPEDDAVVLDEEELDEDIQEELVEDEVEREEVRAEAKAHHGPGPLRRLYRGETSFDFVGRRKWWFTVSAIIIVAGLASLGIRGLNLGITFKGGTAWQVTANGVTQSQAVKVVEAAGLTQPTVEILGSGSHQTIEVQADLNSDTSAQRTAESTKVETALAKATGEPKEQVSHTFVGPTWGSQVTQKAIIALVVFFVVIAIYISIRFEPKMAVAAFVALAHDLLVTAGVYSLAGFQVTPDTVIAVLTILGYSLYDTVVVFDRVRDNTRGFGASGRMTYSDMINLSMNQTLARSINTSLVAILPVLAVLLIGAELLGATTLQDYGLALTVGLLSGAYSSIFIASPVLAMLKEREPRYITIRQRLEARGERTGVLTPSAAAALIGAGAAGGRQGAGRPVKGAKGGRPGTIRPGQARAGQKKAAPAKAAPAKAAATKGTATKAAATKGAPAKSSVIKPSAAKVASAGGGSAAESDGAAENGQVTAAGAGAATSGSTGGPTGASTGAGRPAPRPRKGGSRSAKGKRRR